MKVRYNRHSIDTLVENSLKEGLDAIADDSGHEVYNHVSTSSKWNFKFLAINEEGDRLEGYRFLGWISCDSYPEKRIRLYRPDQLPS